MVRLRAVISRFDGYCVADHLAAADMTLFHKNRIGKECYVALYRYGLWLDHKDNL